MKLTTADQERYENLKSAVKDGMAICYIVGAALREIKERQFYLADGYKTFEEFCDGEWGWTKRYCNQLIVDVGAINSLPEPMRKLITSHKAATELSRIPEILRVEVVRVATEDGTKPATQEAIRRSAPPRPATPKKPANGQPAPKAAPSRPAPKSGTPVPAGPTDKTGLPIPAESLNLWNRGIEAREVVTYVRSVISKLKSFQKESDPLFAEVDFTDILAKLNQVQVDLERAIPHAVCHECNGTKLRDKCQTCRGRGFVSEFFWSHAVPEEFRKMREGK